MPDRRHRNIIQKVAARRTVAVAAGVLVACSLVGCIGGSSTKTSGTFVGAETMERIEPGETTADRVRAMLGQPSRVNSTDDGSQIWVYQWKRTAKGGGMVFPIAFGNSSTETSGRAYVEVREGVVVDAWRD